MSIITRRGDSGETDLLFGKRTPKTGRRVEALGAIDELNAMLGLTRASGAPEELEEIVDHVQDRLIGLMGLLATLPEDMERYEEKGYAKIDEADVEWIEARAGEFEERGVKFTGWARPGAEHSVSRAGLDMARAVARRAERRVLDLHEHEGPVPEAVRLYFNRLADLLWIMARVEG